MDVRVRLSNHSKGVHSLGDCLVTLAGLILVLDNVLLLELTHALDFVKVYNEALVVPVQRLDALAAEDVQMVRAIEVLDTFRVLLA